MTGIKSVRRKEYDDPMAYNGYGTSVEVTLVIDRESDREKQRLIEEKIDKLFDDVEIIMKGHPAVLRRTEERQKGQEHGKR